MADAPPTEAERGGGNADSNADGIADGNADGNADTNADRNGGAHTDPALDFCIRLARTCAVLTRRLDNKLSGVHGLSFSHFMVLYSLDRADGQRLRRIDLAERMGMTASGVTRMLMPLEKIGLVSRQADPRDARAVLRS